MDRINVISRHQALTLEIYFTLYTSYGQEKEFDIIRHEKAL